MGDLDAALRYVVPGFLALKIFAEFGLKTRRTDLELTLWSLLAAALINAGVDAAFPTFDPTRHLIAAVLVAVVAGGLGATGWVRGKRRWPRLGFVATRRSWDAALGQSRWIQVWLSSGEVISGYPRNVAESADVDDPDLYLEDVAWVDVNARQVVPMTGAEGVWVPQSSITFIQTMDADAEPDPGTDTAPGAPSPP